MATVKALLLLLAVNVIDVSTGAEKKDGFFIPSSLFRPFMAPIASDTFLKDFYKHMCMDSLDCFSRMTPVVSPKEMCFDLPPSKTLSPKFLVYTPLSSNDCQVLEPTKKSLSTSTLDPTLETKILIHGYTVILDSADVRFLMKDELLNHSPMNVIIVDWSRDNRPPYLQAVANARAVGALIAKLINYHVENKNMDPKSFHIIGHSLGAHVAGYTGKRVHGLGRVTGLDPAGPCFRHAAPKDRLDSSDAEFVDVIHTNAALKGEGLSKPLGHLDFYPNGGRHQPGCETAAKLMTGGERTLKTDGIFAFCSHSRANYLFLDSIQKEKYVGVQCDNYEDFLDEKCEPDNSTVALMGYPASKPSIPTEGTRFYLRTKEEYTPLRVREEEEEEEDL